MHGAPSGHVKMPEQSGRRDAEPVYFLLHIPKTAGQTIQQHFAQHCAPGVFWQSSRRVNFARGDRSDDLPDPSRARIIAGHHISRSFQNLFPDREIRPILLLRDPLELQISFYNWQMMNNIAIGVGTYGFDLHLRALPLNFMTDFLLWSWLEIPRGALRVMAEGKKYDILNRMMAEFWFVAAHTDCDRLIAEIGPDLGVPPTARRRNTSAALQSQTGWRLLTSASLPAAMRCAMRARNRVDQALWENWRAAGFNSAAIHPPLLEAGRKRGLPLMKSSAPGSGFVDSPRDNGVLGRAPAKPGRLSSRKPIGRATPANGNSPPGAIVTRCEACRKAPRSGFNTGTP